MAFFGLNFYGHRDVLERVENNNPFMEKTKFAGREWGILDSFLLFIPVLGWIALIFLHCVLGSSDATDANLKTKKIRHCTTKEPAKISQTEVDALVHIDKTSKLAFASTHRSELRKALIEANQWIEKLPSESKKLPTVKTLIKHIDFLKVQI